MPDPRNRISTMPDASAKNWFDRFGPGWLKPYGRLARWDRPIGWWLLLCPCWWSLALAASVAGWSQEALGYLVLFWIGAVAMRGAGCTYNDIVDRDIDAQVARTRNRPLPSGAVMIPHAMAFMVAQSLVGLAVLLQFNRATVVTGLVSLAVVAAYPFMKRITNWPQFVLGLAFSWGALVGWTAIHSGLQAPAFALYFAAVAWTIGYDTIYAHQDREDDAIIGVRSTARLFGRNTHLVICLFYLAAAALIFLALYTAASGIMAYLGLAAMGAHLAWQVATLDTQDPDNCLARFRSNRTAGLLLFAGLAADGLGTPW